LFAELKSWIDGFPWWAVALGSFAAGAATGLLLRIVRRGSHETKDA
jgi:hypothetical protein